MNEKKCWVVQTQKSVPNEDKIWPLKNIKKKVMLTKREKGKKILINRKKTYQIPIGR